MQWVFLVLAVAASLVALHTGTFYLAAVAAAALLTTLIGFWLHNDLLILVFLLLCAILTAAVAVLRGKSERHRALPDFDIGQRVSVQSVSQHGDRLLVSYRGTTWEAVMDDRTILGPGDTAIIKRKTDKLLHLVVPPEVART